MRFLSRIFNPTKLQKNCRKMGKRLLKSNFSRQSLKLFPLYWITSGIEHEAFGYGPSAIQIRQQFVHETFLQLGFILKRIDTFYSQTRLAAVSLKKVWKESEKIQHNKSWYIDRNAACSGKSERVFHFN